MDVTMIGLQNAGKSSLLRVLAVSSSFFVSNFLAFFPIIFIPLVIGVASKC